eukprot:5443019-Pyramimonas_sp.AAC.1
MSWQPAMGQCLSPMGRDSRRQMERAMLCICLRNVLWRQLVYTVIAKEPWTSSGAARGLGPRLRGPGPISGPRSGRVSLQGTSRRPRRQRTAR